MAERLKVFVNQDFTATDLVNGDEFSLVSTTATSQALIKDVLSSSNVDMDLLNNDFAIGGVGNLTGSEILDTDSTLKFKLKHGSAQVGNDALQEFRGYVSTNSYRNLVVSLSKYPNSVTAENGENDTLVNFSPTVNSNIIMYHIASNGYEYYATDDSNSSQLLYRKTSPTAAWSNINSSATGWTSYTAYCYYEGFLYYVTGSTLYKFNFETESSSYVGNFSTTVATPSYPRLSIANGIAFAGYTGQSANLLYLNITENTKKGYIYGIRKYVSSNTFDMIYHNSNYYCMEKNSTTIYARKFSNVITTGNFTPSYSEYSYDGVYNAYKNKPKQVKDGGTIIMAGETAGAIILDINDLSKVSTVGDNLIQGLIPHNKVLITNLSQYNINLSAKVSGVEITGV